MSRTRRVALWCLAVVAVTVASVGHVLMTGSHSSWWTALLGFVAAAAGMQVFHHSPVVREWVARVHVDGKYRGLSALAERRTQEYLARQQEPHEDAVTRPVGTTPTSSRDWDFS